MEFPQTIINTILAMKKIVCILFALLCILSMNAKIKNPIFWSDKPDPDIIRVGQDYYLVYTTMHLMPGAPVLHSRDLVHWDLTGYIFNKLTDSPKYSLQQGSVYGRGQWATSLKYHKGTFYALFAPNDNPGGDTYIYTTKDPYKGWTLRSRLPHFHDASLLFDDDDRVYVFSNTGKLQELNADLTAVKEGGINQLIFKRDSTETGLLEGSRAIKYQGKYYLLMISWPNGKPRNEVCYRADKISGPWEKKKILESQFGGFYYVGQGTIVDTPDNKWYGLIFQDRGAVGRVLTLMPCTWTDGWPILGDANGKVPEELDLNGTNQMMVYSDEFNGSLSRWWQWNHNPIDKAWSVKERKGFLRLHTSSCVPNLYLAPNTPTQSMEGPQCTASICMDISKMKDGDKAGFAAFNGDAGVLTVARDKGICTLAMSEQHMRMNKSNHGVEGVDEKILEQTTLTGKESAGRTAMKSHCIYLRIDADFTSHQDMATFYYSTDNKNWKQIGKPFKMIFDYRRFFMGTRFAIFNYATQQSGGYVDVDWFHYQRK